MSNSLEIAGAQSAPSDFAPLHVNRMMTGLWTNSNPLRDAASSLYEEKFYGGRQDQFVEGLNGEISAKLTYRRRYGHTVYNSQTFPPIKRFYAFNTFTLTDESVRVMADTANVVYDATGPNTQRALWTKTGPAAGMPTYFLGVGNILYFTNGVENKQWDYTSDQIFDWGIQDPTVAPTAAIPAWAGYTQWLPNVVVQRASGYGYGGVRIIDPTGNSVQEAIQYGTTGIGDPGGGWNQTEGQHTIDGSVTWNNIGNGQWLPSHNWGFGVPKVIHAIAQDGNTYFFGSTTNGNTGPSSPTWLTGINSLTPDGDQKWKNLGRALYRPDVGDATPVGLGQTGTPATILDANGTVQQCIQAGKTGTTTPAFSTIKTALTSDPSGNPQGAAIWQATGSIATVKYGYAYMNSKTKDISNMSPWSNEVTSSDGEEVDVTGPYSPDSQVDTVVLFRTTHGGAIPLYLGQIPNVVGTGTWNYADTTLDADLTFAWQGMLQGEATPLPKGATALAYHVGRVFAAVGNVVYVSSGPDAVVGGASGNSGFATTFTCQSKITRFWVNSIGVVVFTVRDAYIVLGSGTDSDPLYMVTYITNIPLLSYDCLAVFLTNAYLLTGNKLVGMLDPSSGIVESSFPIADQIRDELDPTNGYVTFMTGPSGETAMYVSNGTDRWFRMSPTSTPEIGINWSTRALITGGMSAVQAVETDPGKTQLLLGPPAPGGPILKRDSSTHRDNGQRYQMTGNLGSIVLANPGQLAGLAWVTLEASAKGTAPLLSVLLDEVETADKTKYELVKRTRQDPPNLPPSTTIFSNRHSLLQGQSPVWCRHIRMYFDWGDNDGPDELLTFTIFGQVWKEQRSQ